MMQIKKLWDVLKTAHPSTESTKMALRQKSAEPRHRELADRLREAADGIGNDAVLDAELRLDEDSDESFLLSELTDAAAKYRQTLKRAARSLDGKE